MMRIDSSEIFDLSRWFTVKPDTKESGLFSVPKFTRKDKKMCLMMQKCSSQKCKNICKCETLTVCLRERKKLNLNRNTFRRILIWFWEDKNFLESWQMRRNNITFHPVSILIQGYFSWLNKACSIGFADITNPWKLYGETISKNVSRNGIILPRSV